VLRRQGSGSACFFINKFMQTPELRISLETITPVRAEYFLAKNRNNRGVKEQNIRKLESDLLSGNFKTTHQGIAFDWNDNLIDGQHRLMAIARSGVTAKMYVTYNCNPENFKLIDSGSARTASDTLKSLGAQWYSSSAAGIRLILWAHDCYDIRAKVVDKKLYKRYRTTNAETAAFYHAHQGDISDCAHIASVVSSHNPALMRSSLIAFLYLAKKKHGTTAIAHEFIERVAHGANLHPKSVELALSKFINVKPSDVALQNYKKGEFMLVAYIKAFNKYLNGDSMVQFRVGIIDGVPNIVAV
jgi:hypothetical protein